MVINFSACLAILLLVPPVNLFSVEHTAINVFFAVPDREMQQFRETDCSLSFLPISKSKLSPKDYIDWLPLYDYVANKPVYRVNTKLRPGTYAVALRFNRTNNLDFANNIPLGNITVSSVSNKFIMRLPSLWSMLITLIPNKHVSIDDEWSLEIHSRDKRYAANLNLLWNDGNLTGDWLEAMENEALSFSLRSSTGKYLYLGTKNIKANDLIEGRISFNLNKAR